MSKRIVVAGIMGIFLIVILSAAFIPHFGKINSTINILPPEIGVDVPETEDDCQNGGWEDLMTLGVRFFDDESDCINYVQTYMCEDFKLLGGYPEDFDSSSSCESYFSGDGTIGELNETGGENEG